MDRAPPGTPRLGSDGASSRDDEKTSRSLAAQTLAPPRISLGTVVPPEAKKTPVGPSKTSHGSRASTSAVSAPTNAAVEGVNFTVTDTRGGANKTIDASFDQKVTTKFHNSFTILIDRSASMGTNAGGGKTRMEVAHEAFETLVNEVAEKRRNEPSDLICVWTFNHEARRAMVGPAHNFNLKHRGLQGDFRPSGGTDLPHAMQTALAGMKEYNEKVKQKHKNAVVQWLVVLTDGDTSSLRLTREQTIAMLQEASHSVWNFKVCFIGIGQSASETAVLQEMAAAVKDRLRTPGGIVCATQGTDIASMRKVFQEASTMVRKIQDKLVVEKGNEKIMFRGQAAQQALQAVLSGSALGQLSLGSGSGSGSSRGGNKRLLK